MFLNNYKLFNHNSLKFNLWEIKIDIKLIILGERVIIEDGMLEKYGKLLKNGDNLLLFYLKIYINLNDGMIVYILMNK